MEKFFADYVLVLEKLHRDFIATFDDLPAEALDWVPGDDMNSFCALVVHTTGSARYWIGDAALGDPSNRKRLEEFQAKGLTHAELKARFTALEEYVRGRLANLTLADLATVRTINNTEGQPFEVAAAWALAHALEHTGIHLGHAQITRQLWQKREY
jgi:hypothetical protein